MRCKGIFAALAVAAAAMSSLRGGTKPTVKSIGESLMCQCGCPETVTLCNHLNCSSRGQMEELIQKEIDAGKSETTVVQDFVLRYGVKVLATPPAKGFNLTVWILPGVGLVAGFAVLMVLTRRWRKPGAGPRPAGAAPLDPKLRAALEEEMKTSGLGT